MKKQYNHKPFEGKIKQLKKETLILVNLNEVKEFVQECFNRRIKVGVGSVYKDGVIIYEDEN